MGILRIFPGLNFGSITSLTCGFDAGFVAISRSIFKFGVNLGCKFEAFEIAPEANLVMLARTTQATPEYKR